MPDIVVHHRDEDLIVVAKPAGLLSVPAPSRRQPSLPDLLHRQLGLRVLPVHRLDEETSGAIVFALNDVARKGVEELFRRHDLERIYLALLTAVPNPQAGIIRARLRDDGDRVRVVTQGGEMAVTEYEVLARRERGCLVRCRLQTGRRNQIRAHFAELGCPVCGDRKYGWRIRSGPKWPQLMLHSWRIAFRHPVTGAPVDATVPPPHDEMQP